MAFHANQGPRMGLPQMIQSRAQFGIRGAIVPFIAAVFVYIGFKVFDVDPGHPGPRPRAARRASGSGTRCSSALSIVIAVVGHDLLHFVQRWLTYFLIVVVRDRDRAGAFTTLPAPTRRARRRLRPHRAS